MGDAGIPASRATPQCWRGTEIRSNAVVINETAGRAGPRGPASHAPLPKASASPIKVRADGAGKGIRTPDLLMTSEPAPSAVLPDENPGRS